MKSRFFTYLFLLAIIFSCTKEKIEYHSFPENIWNSEDEVSFDINIEDTIRLYCLNFSFRHTTSYRYQNIIFFTHHYFNNDKISTDTINLELALNNGEWLGSGKSDIREFNHPYKVAERYNKGKHTFKLELAMRENNNPEITNLEHISDISIYILEVDE